MQNVGTYIFMEVAAQHDLEGANVELLREAIDYRQKLVLTDLELKSGLKYWLSAGLIRQQGPKYFLSPSIVRHLPRTISGRISFRRRAWETFWKNRLQS